MNQWPSQGTILTKNYAAHPPCLYHQLHQSRVQKMGFPPQLYCSPMEMVMSSALATVEWWVRSCLETGRSRPMWIANVEVVGRDVGSTGKKPLVKMSAMTSHMSLPLISWLSLSRQCWGQEGRSDQGILIQMSRLGEWGGAKGFVAWKLLIRC